MTNDTAIEEATEAHLPSIGPLISELFEVSDSAPEGGPEHAVENCLTLIQDSSRQLLVARAGDSLAGFVNFATRRTILHARPSGLIVDIIVRDRCRGQGIGKHMISATALSCRELGCGVLEVSTERTNTRAREFYKK